MPSEAARRALEKIRRADEEFALDLLTIPTETIADIIDSEMVDPNLVNELLESAFSEGWNGATLGFSKDDAMHLGLAALCARKGYDRYLPLPTPDAEVQK